MADVVPPADAAQPPQPPAAPSDLDILYGPGAAARIASANVLVVGAGGVGCEVVKNLAFAGFRRFTAVDLDTIDVSNLNRQFLFRREHVTKPKAVTAAAAIKQMVPTMDIEGVVANIKDTRFNVTFFKSFDIVCNALDNADARRHVNRMCLAADVPLLESGSTGYNGQVYVVTRDVECFDCNQAPKQKSYPVCTIRSTPEKPVHCVVWAKSLWDLIFAPDDGENLLADLDGGGDATVGAEGSTNGNRSAKKPARRVRYVDEEPAREFASRVCARVFVDDVNEQAAMKELWTSRAPPTPYDVDAVLEDTAMNVDDLNLLEQRVWSKEECARVLNAVLLHMVTARRAEIGSVSFDKDDRDALAFVIAAANLRAAAYGVECSTPFHVKGIAGSIVHAVATTNAIVGGLVVLEALKIVAKSGSIAGSKNSFVTYWPRGCRVRKVIEVEALQKPKPNCFVCSKGQLELTLDTEATSLRMFVDNVLRSRISAQEPSVNVSTGNFHNTLYECGQGLEEDEVEMYNENLNKTLAELRVTTGSQFQIEDLQQSLTCTIHVVHEKGCEGDKPVTEQFILKGAATVNTAGDKAVSKSGVHDPKNLDLGDNDIDEVECVGDVAKTSHEAHPEIPKTAKSNEEDIPAQNGGAAVTNGTGAKEAGQNGTSTSNGVSDGKDPEVKSMNVVETVDDNNENADADADASALKKRKLDASAQDAGKDAKRLKEDETTTSAAPK